MKTFDEQYSFYVPGFFWVELNTAKELHDIFDSEFERTLFHEYLHFLQDITTTYGYANSSHVMNLIKSVYHNVKIYEQLRLHDINIPFDFSPDKFRHINNKLFCSYLQYYNDKDYIFDDFIIDKITPECINIEGYNVHVFNVMFNDSKKIRFGAHAIFESISYVLENDRYGKLDGRTYLPYDLPEKIAIFYSPIFHHKRNLIDLCEYSLMFYNSAEVFMDILTGLQKDNFNPSSTKEFYDYMKTQVSLRTETLESFFENEKNELISQLNGVFVSELYDGFKKWIISTIDNGFDLKTRKKLMFSSLLSCDPTYFLKNSIMEIGMPPIFNQDGKMFIRNSLFDINSWSYLTRAISSVFETIVYGKTSCSLKEACLFSNEMREEQMNVNQYCDLEPWKKKDEDNLCPYCAVWKTFGLQKMNCVVETKHSI